MIRLNQILMVLIGILLLPPMVSAEIPLTDYNALRDISVSKEGTDTLISFKFKNPLRQKLEPDFFKRSVQLDFFLTYVDPPKRYFPVEGALISQIYVSQFDRELMRVRFMLKEDDSVGRGDFEMSAVGRYLKVRIKGGSAGGFEPQVSADEDLVFADEENNDEALDELLKRAVGAASRAEENFEETTETITIQNEVLPEPEVAVGQKKINPIPEENSKTARAVKNEAGTLKKKSAPETRPLRLKDAGSGAELFAREEGDEEGLDSLWGSAFKMISTLAFVIGLMFLVFHFFKKWVLKEGVFGSGEKPIRVISTGFLAPKKSIALVEVAGRVLILGISNEQISLLSSLEDEEEVDRFLKTTPHGVQAKAPKGESVSAMKKEPVSPSIKKEEKVDVYPEQRKSFSKRLEKVTNPFSSYVKEFVSSQPEKKQSVDTLKRMIRQKAGKVNVGA